MRIHAGSRGHGARRTALGSLLVDGRSAARSSSCEGCVRARARCGERAPRLGGAARGSPGERRRVARQSDARPLRALRAARPHGGRLRAAAGPRALAPARLLRDEPADRAGLRAARLRGGRLLRWPRHGVAAPRRRARPRRPRRGSGAASRRPLRGGRVVAAPRGDPPPRPGVVTGRVRRGLRRGEDARRALAGDARTRGSSRPGGGHRARLDGRGQRRPRDRRDQGRPPSSRSSGVPDGPPPAPASPGSSSFFSGRLRTGFVRHMRNVPVCRSSRV